MNELNKRLYDNYIQELKEYLEFLKSKGYVLIKDYGTTNIRVNKYNGRKNKFIPMYELFEFPTVVLNDVPNYYEFDVNTIIANLTREILPELTHEDLRDYTSYLNYSERVHDEKKLKKEFQELKKLNKNMEAPKIEKSLYEIPKIQAEVLIKEFVIFADSKGIEKGYYKYDKSSNNFRKLHEDDIIEILNKYFNVSNVFQRFKILNNMNKVYLHQLLNSDLPIRWNEHQKASNLMKANEKAYKEVKKITDVFI